MHGPVAFEISRSSRISPSIAANVPWGPDASLILDSARGLDGGHLALSSEWFGGRHTGGRRRPSRLGGALARPADIVALHGALRKVAHVVGVRHPRPLVVPRVRARDAALSRRAAAAAAFASACVGGPRRDASALRAEPYGQRARRGHRHGGALAALAIARRDWRRTASALTSRAPVAGRRGRRASWPSISHRGPLRLPVGDGPLAALALAARRWWTRPPAPRPTRVLAARRWCAAGSPSGSARAWGARSPPIQTLRRGSSVSRRPSPKRLIPSTVTRMARPGNVASHHAVEM